MSRIPERVDSKYRYVLLASKRAEQLVEGAVPKKEAGKGKPTRVAMSEITSGLVDWDYGPAAEPEGESAEGLVDGDAEPGEGEGT
jgi:DNA-directed RNA polymerase omega subunit